MPLDTRFLEATAPLYSPGMGTENAGPLLYSLIRFTRPRRVMEIGLGYTSPFIVQALADCEAEWRRDYELIKADSDDLRSNPLWEPYYDSPYEPVHYAIDDLSSTDSSADRVLDVLGELGLREMVTMHNGDFRGYSKSMDDRALPLDFVWFDCGGPVEYVAFFEEYWPLVNQAHGLVALHYTYWNMELGPEGNTYYELMPSPLLNAINQQHTLKGPLSNFEVFSLVETWKHRQGSVTLIRKLPPSSMPRKIDYEDEMRAMFGKSPGPMPRL